MRPRTAKQDKENKGELFLTQRKLKGEFWNKGWAVRIFIFPEQKTKVSLSPQHTHKKDNHVTYYRILESRTDE